MVQKALNLLLCMQIRKSLGSNDLGHEEPGWPQRCLNPHAVASPNAPKAAVRDGAPALEVVQLEVSLTDSRGLIRLLQDVNLRITPGEIVGLVGPSGAGKTTLARAILGVLPRGVVVSGEIRVGARFGSLSRCPIAYIDQDPGATLNPVRRVGGQVVEVLRRNHGCNTSAARRRAGELFQRLSLPAALLDAYPHQLSGGQQQRVAIARAIACDPAVVIADEPGSALDVVSQVELIDALLAWRREIGFAVLLISHEAALIHGLCDRLVRLEHGRLQIPAPAAGPTERCA